MASDPTHSSSADRRAAPKRAELPPRAVLALEHLQQICASMFGLVVSAGGAPSAFETDGLMYGACISLIGEFGCREVALFGDEAGCSGLAKAMFAMEGAQTPLPDEIVDAMGELINMVSGAVKTRLDQQEHEKITIGVPMFLVSRSDCEKYRTKVIPLISQRLVSAEIQGEFLLVWSERTPVVLLEEARAWLVVPSDKLALGNGLAALNELSEMVSSSTAPENADAIEMCVRAVTDVINELPSLGLDYVVQVIDALTESLKEDLLLPLRMPAIAQRFVEPDPEELARQVTVERDAETLEMLGEFLSESQEGLDRCDEILLQIEQGQLTSESIDALFRQFHTIKGVASFHDLLDIEQLAHSTENLLASVRDGKRAFEGTSVDLVFESTSLMSRLMVGVREAVEGRLSFPVSRRARALREKVEAVLRGEDVNTKGLGRNPGPEEEAGGVAGTKVIKETVKVDLEQLNELESLLPSFDQIDCLLEGYCERLPPLAEVQEQLRDLQRQVESVTARMKMVPLRALFQKMSRMVRDLSKKTEKLSRLVLEGEDARVERNIADKLNGPLVHMIRNAIDHGLESADERREAGKPLIGTIGLAARVNADSVVLEITDDGRGLDPVAIRHKATEKGLIDEARSASDEDLFLLIFEPGFSTAATVTAISGRGVGMDVVRREVEALGGKIEIESERRKGSVFRVRVPHFQ